MLRLAIVFEVLCSIQEISESEALKEFIFILSLHMVFICCTHSTGDILVLNLPKELRPGTKFILLIESKFCAALSCPLLHVITALS